MGRYVEVITDRAVPGTQTLTYLVGDDMCVRVGARVVVTISGNRCIGVVASLHDSKPDYRVMPIKEVIDIDELLVTQADVELWQWVAQYYMTPLAVVYKTVMPAYFRNDTLTWGTEIYIEIAAHVDVDEALNKLKRAHKQEEVLLRLLSIKQDNGCVSRSQLLNNEESLATALRQLYAKKILLPTEYRISLPPLKPFVADSNDSLYATLCVDINEGLRQKDRVLLFERDTLDKIPLYCRLIVQQIENGKQTLILAPDSYAAESIYENLCDRLGQGVVAYFTTLSDSRRMQAFVFAVSTAKIVVGARGAVFLPMQRLGLLIVEQEHDAGYKNRDSAPRINVRDVAMVKAAKSGAGVILTSEAPSVESYYNATRGAWSLVEYQNNEQREVQFMVLERGKELLSTYLRRRIGEAMERGEQALIFQNRRGFSVWVECSNCGDIPECENCSVSLTYHKSDNTLQCHYCGFKIPFTNQCGKCGSSNIDFQGRGTERIEESIKHIFPDARVLRLDYDSTRGKGAFERIAAAVATSSCDIIVGTQMIVRGLDFRKISVVGIVNADNMLSQSDFRTSERAFSLLTQLSNRIGTQNGEVIIQTTKRLNNVITSVEQRHHRLFYEQELAQRKTMNYPPYVRMLSISFSHKDRAIVFGASQMFEQALRPVFGNRLSPVFEPVVERQMNAYILQFYIRVEREKSIIRAKEIIRRILTSVSKSYSELHVVIDVDPL